MHASISALSASTSGDRQIAIIDGSVGSPAETGKTVEGFAGGSDTRV
jgi:hypothetical protein